MTYKPRFGPPLRLFAVAAFGLALAGCAAENTRIAAPPAGKSAPSAGGRLGSAGQAASALDQTSAEEKAAALAAGASAGERALGKAVVALGPPAEAGLWVQSVLVKQKGQGRVVAPDGRSLKLELRPGSGGALLSLSAYQALGLSLTSLPELTLYGQ